LSDRRKRLHELLLALINKEADFDLIEVDSSEFNSTYSKKNSVNFSQVIERNRKILNKYQSLIKTAVTLDALMDSENDENYKLKK
tara:strand:+ start:1410 stop:1664 length:255 start_codon:yes stop_codon:yes gene_type:complete